MTTTPPAQWATPVSAPRESGSTYFVYILVLVAAAAHFALLRTIFNRDFPLATLQALIDGTAYKPFQFRILIPWIVGQLNHLTGAPVFLLYQVVESLAVASVVLSLRYLIRAYFSTPLVDLIAFCGLLLLPWNYIFPQEIGLFIPADTPAVAFFATLVALMVRGKWRWYYPVFVVATFNRETTCFITLIFLFTHWRVLSRTELAGHLIVQILIWLSIRFFLSQLYAANPGAGFEIYGAGSHISHFAANLEFLTTPSRVLILLSSFAYLWVPVLLWYSHVSDNFLRCALWVLVAHFIAMLIIGNLNETRIFGEFMPLVYLFFVVAVTHKFNLADRLGFHKS